MGKNRAMGKLGERLCGNDAMECQALRGRITPWKTGANGKEVCAMALIKADELEAWRRSAVSTEKLDADLAKAVDQLLAKLESRVTKVAVDRIADNGIPGGPRADWLRARLERQLQGKAQIVDVPAGWAGDGLPPGVDVVIRGDVFARHEAQVPTLEANFRALTMASLVVGNAHVAFPEAAAPQSGKAAPPLPQSSNGLSIHLDAHSGGSLCAGEKTQVWLKSDSRAYVRVFNLYGNGQALLVFPSEATQNGEVAAGANVAIGGNGGMQAIPVPGSEEERFLVLAAPSEADLGAFRAVKGQCRLPAKIATDLHRGEGLPRGAKVASDGYRLVSGRACGEAPSEQQRRVMAAALEGLPECEIP